MIILALIHITISRRSRKRKDSSGPMACDLSPIETLWYELKDKLAAKYPKLQGTKELRSKALKA